MTMRRTGIHDPVLGVQRRRSASSRQAAVLRSDDSSTTLTSAQRAHARRPGACHAQAPPRVDQRASASSSVGNDRQVLLREEQASGNEMQDADSADELYDMESETYSDGASTDEGSSDIEQSDDEGSYQDGDEGFDVASDLEAAGSLSSRDGPSAAVPNEAVSASTTISGNEVTAAEAQQDHRTLRAELGLPEDASIPRVCTLHSHTPLTFVIYVTRVQ